MVLKSRNNTHLLFLHIYYTTRSDQVGPNSFSYLFDYRISYFIIWFSVYIQLSSLASRMLLNREIYCLRLPNWAPKIIFHLGEHIILSRPKSPNEYYSLWQLFFWSEKIKEYINISDKELSLFDFLMFWNKKKNDIFWFFEEKALSLDKY